MPSQETSADHLLEAIKAAVDSNVENQRLMNGILAEVRQQPRQATGSSVTIHAGGLANAIAVCVSLSMVVVFILFGVWTMWQIGEVRGQQEAWIQVWQQKVSDHKWK